MCSGKCSKLSNAFIFLFFNKMLDISAGIHKMLVRIANRVDRDQTASSDMGLYCLSRPSWQANLRCSTDSSEPSIHFRQLKEQTKF